MLEIRPAVSVIVPAYRADQTIGPCIDALLRQNFDAPYEVVVVASADDTAKLPILPGDPRVRPVMHIPRLGAAQARNRGAGVAGADLMAFTDADAIASPDWLGRLVDASDGGRLCVAGGVLNGTPTSVAGSAEYLVAFLDLHPGRPAATAWHGATCNLLVPRTVWNDLGPFPEDMDGGEDTLLTVAARGRGAFTFSGDAVVTHLNRVRFGEVVSHQFAYGRFTARLGRRSPYKLRPLVRYTLLAPLAGMGRVASLYARVIRWSGASPRQTLVVTPAVMVCLAAWTLGLVVEGLRLDWRWIRGRRIAARMAAPSP